MAAPNPTPIPNAGPKPERPRKAGGGPDLASIGGLVLALAGILGGLILEKGSIQDVAQATAAMIVFGGTIGAVLVTTRMPVFLGACRALRKVFWNDPPQTAEKMDLLVQYATKARKNGIVSLEEEANNSGDPFLKKALSLAVDGTELKELRSMMDIDIQLAEQAAEAEAKVWESAGGFAPTIGIIGAVMGLIQVMKHLEDIKEVGHGIAVAFVATVYGVGSANIVFLPAAAKLRAHMQAATMIKDMTLEGIAGIVEGLNPTLIRLKLEAYNREAVKAKKPAGKGAPKPGGPGPQPVQGR